jgi:hypothetical protein
MPTTSIHVGDVGVSFEVTIRDQSDVVVDLSTSTYVGFRFLRPDGLVLVVPATFITNGVDGTIRYVTETNDLTVSGTWQYQIHVTFLGKSFMSDINTFTVNVNLPT